MRNQYAQVQSCFGVLEGHAHVSIPPSTPDDKHYCRGHTDVGNYKKEAGCPDIVAALAVFVEAADVPGPTIRASDSLIIFLTNSERLVDRTTKTRLFSEAFGEIWLCSFGTPVARTRSCHVTTIAKCFIFTDLALSQIGDFIVEVGAGGARDALEVRVEAFSLDTFPGCDFQSQQSIQKENAVAVVIHLTDLDSDLRSRIWFHVEE